MAAEVSSRDPIEKLTQRPGSSTRASIEANRALSEDLETSNSPTPPTKTVKEKSVTLSAEKKSKQRTISTRAKKITLESEENEEEDDEEREKEKELSKKKKSSAAANNSSSGDARIHVGSKFQASLKNFELLSEEERSQLPDEPEKEHCLWKCAANIDEAELNNYLEEAAVCHLTMDKALFILQSCHFDFLVATNEMRNRRSISEDWNEDDVILFKQAFHLFGKNFSKIRQALPHRPLSSIIQHYYSVKKQWKQKSFIQEKQAELQQKEDNEGEEEDYVYQLPIVKADLADEPTSAEKLLEFASRFEDGMCANCGHLVKSITTCDGKKLCYACTLYYKSHNTMRPCQPLGAVREEEKKRQFACPPDMLDIVSNFAELSAPVEESKVKEEIKTEEGESSSAPIVSVVQSGRSKCDEAISEMKRIVTELKVSCARAEARLEVEMKEIPDVEKYRYLLKEARKENRIRLMTTWSNADKFVAFHSLIRYNLDFAAVSEIVKTKSVEMVKAFYTENKERIDKCILEAAGPSATKSEVSFSISPQEAQKS